MPFYSIEEDDMLNFSMFIVVPLGAANELRICDTFDKVSKSRLPEAFRSIHELDELTLIT